MAAPRLVLPAISVGDAEASEGGTLSFRVALEPAASGPVTVAFETIDGTALAGSDYTAASGTLNFKAGDREKTVAVAVADDDLAEGVETLTLRLSAPTGATLADGEASGTVTDAAEAAALTGAFGEVPAEHDGTDAFTVELRFSAAPAGLSYKTVKDSLFQVTGGRIDKARRIEPPSNLRYALTVQPEGGAAVTLSLAALPGCGAAGAVCTADRESLTGPAVAHSAGSGGSFGCGRAGSRGAGSEARIPGDAQPCAPWCGDGGLRDFGRHRDGGCGLYRCGWDA